MSARAAAPGTGLVIGTATLLAAAAIGFWFQMQPEGALGAVRPAPVGTPPAAVTPAVAPPTPSVTQTRPLAPQGPAVAEKMPGPATSGAPRAQPPGPASPVRITADRLQVHPGIAHAWQALAQGDLALAERSYEQALAAEPRNSEALHGLAAIALRRSQWGVAQDFYLRVLEADPKDAAAHAALISLGSAEPLQDESRLKVLLAAQPEAAPLHFALGNLYAGQGRWGEAQQAYARAWAADGDNPDYAFNLAVSFDRLRRGQLALAHYRSALALARTRAVAFDPGSVAARVRELRH